MKKVWTLLLLISSSLIYGQQDYQWMVRDGIGRVECNYLNQITDNAKVSKILEPKPQYLDKKYCNDYFIILNNGTYYMNDWTSNCFLPTSVDPQQIFNVISVPSSSIKYVYLTNRYEDDDPPEDIDVQSSNNTTNSIIDDMFPNQNYGKFTNHNLVNGKDITFILPENNDICNYHLNHEGDVDLLSLIPSGFEGDGPNNNYNALLNNGTINPYPNPVPFMGNSAPIPNDLNSGFLNYRVEVDESLIDTEVQFSFIPQNAEESRKCPVENFSISVSDKFHDPNYVELKCVWQNSNGKKFGLYHVECFNDEDGDVDVVYLDVQLPNSAIPHTIQYQDWSVCCKRGCGLGTNKLTDLSDLHSSAKRVRFPKQLKGIGDGKSCKNTAWFEFIVQFDSSTNLVFDDLSLGIPQSQFEDHEYQIPTFYDHMSCYTFSQLDSLDDAQLHSEMQIYPGDADCYQGRTVNNCNQGCSSPTFGERMKSCFCGCKKAKF